MKTATSALFYSDESYRQENENDQIFRKFVNYFGKLTLSPFKQLIQRFCTNPAEFFHNKISKLEEDHFSIPLYMDHLFL